MESQVDIVSSIETESPERAGDTKLLQGTKAGARLGTWTVAGTGTLCFGLVLLSRRGTGGAGLMEADFTAETRMELALRAFAKDGFFKGTAEVAEFNFCMRFEQKGQVISNLCFEGSTNQVQRNNGNSTGYYIQTHNIILPREDSKANKDKRLPPSKNQGSFFCMEVRFLDHDEQNPRL
jgi:hypothetical protein